MSFKISIVIVPKRNFRTKKSELRSCFDNYILFGLILSLLALNLQAQENRLPAKESKIIKDTFRYLGSLESKKLKIDRQTYNRHSNFESIFNFPFSGKKLLTWIQSRNKSYSVGATGDFLAYYQNGEVVLGKNFFRLSKLDRLLVILHEARHADGKEFAHIVCPDNFRFLNPRDFRISPAGKKGCDDKADGGYGITASFIFELAAHGLLSSSEAGYRYNSEISRIIIDQ